MMRTRFLSCTFAVSVAALAFAAAASAAQTTVGYSLTPGKCTKPIAVPANNKPVQVMGTQIIYPGTGAGQVTLLRTTGAGQGLLWAGTDYANGAVKGSAQDAGAWIMTLDTVGALILQTAASSHIQVCYDEHGYFPTVAGYLTFMY